MGEFACSFLRPLTWKEFIGKFRIFPVTKEFGENQLRSGNFLQTDKPESIKIRNGGLCADGRRDEHGRSYSQGSAESFQ